jgi:hypothetical protein
VTHRNSSVEESERVKHNFRSPVPKAREILEIGGGGRKSPVAEKLLLKKLRYP